MVILIKGPNNGYGVAQTINDELGPAIPVTPSGVRRALLRLDKHNLVRLADRINITGRKELHYELTDLGRAQVEHELVQLELLLDLADTHRLTFEAHIR